MRPKICEYTNGKRCRKHVACVAATKYLFATRIDGKRG